jgi:hypothetical protein
MGQKPPVNTALIIYLVHVSFFSTLTSVTGTFFSFFVGNKSFLLFPMEQFIKLHKNKIVSRLLQKRVQKNK